MQAGTGEPNWRIFVRALAEEVDSLAGGSERDDMLRGVGSRMARLAPLPPVATLEALEVELNDALATLGWGEARLTLDEPARMLRIVHTGLPRIGSLQAGEGPWLAAMLEGLYESWFAQQPGADASLTARRRPQANLGGTPGTIALAYGKH